MMGDPWKAAAGSSTENEDLISGTIFDPMWLVEWGLALIAIGIGAQHKAIILYVRTDYTVNSC